MKQIHSNNPGSPGHLQTYLFNFRRHSHCTNRDNFKSYQLMIVLQRRPYASGTIKERFSLQQIACFFIQLLNLGKCLNCGCNPVACHSFQKVRKNVVFAPKQRIFRWFLSYVIRFRFPKQFVPVCIITILHNLVLFPLRQRIPYGVLYSPIIRHNRLHIIQRQKRVRTLKIQPTFRLR